MLSFTMLGRIGLERRAGEELDALLRQPKRLALLAYLAMPRPGSWHRRDTLLGVFWPELDASRGRTALRNALYVVRRQLDDGVLRTRGDDDVSLDPARFSTDAALLEDDLQAGRLEEALDRYAGELLPGLFIAEAEGFEKWLDQERDRMRGLAQRAAAALIETRDAAGDLAGAVAAATRAAELDPDAEPLLRRLMELLDRSGASAQALAAYERFHSRMAAEYFSEPSAATNQLAQQIRARRQVVVPLPPPGALPTGDPLPTDPVDPAVATVHLPEARPRWRRMVAPVALVLLAVIVVAAIRWRSRTTPDSAITRSLVVLPVENTTGDPSLDYLATGIPEDVATRLRGIGGLATIHSAARATLPPPARRDLSMIGREFGAEMALRTRLSREGDSLSLVADLVDVATGHGKSIGALRFVAANVTDLESRLAAAVAGAAFRRPVPEDPRATSHPVDPESFRLTLQGWHELLTRHNNAEARRFFTLATERDPANARAWAGISSTWASAAVTWVMPFEEGYSLAEAAALRALAIDSLQGTALANLGLLRGLRDHDLTEGLDLLARSIAVEPGNPESFLLQAALYRHAWRWESARDAIRFARRLDPLNALYVERDAILSLCADQPSEAVPLYQEAIRLNAKAPLVRDGLARAFARLGRWDEAIDQLRTAAAADSNIALVASLPSLRGEQGYWSARAAVARPRLVALVRASSSRWVSRARLGTLYIATGDVDRGLDLLEAEAQAGDIGLARLPCQPDVDGARALPRFQAILAVVARQRPQ